jgi:hypothetical protein
MITFILLFSLYKIQMTADFDDLKLYYFGPINGSRKAFTYLNNYKKKTNSSTI